MSDDDKVICPNCVHEFAAVPVAVQAKLVQLEEGYGHACKLVAQMHAAATGRPGEGPILGVVEDVAAIRAVLAWIVALDLAIDSEEGHNEWGEADCFNQAQTLAREALGAAIAAQKAPT